MNLNFFLAEGGGILDATLRTFGVDWPHLTAQIINFCILAFLLHRFAYRPILQALEERKQRIADSLANADKIKTELAKTETLRQEILDQANTQANQLIAEARAAAERLRETETQKAIATAEQIVAKAREATVLDHARIMNELKQEIGRLVVSTSAKVVGRILTREDQQRLIEEANRQLAA